jgi:hypothetical protein
LTVLEAVEAHCTNGLVIVVDTGGRVVRIKPCIEWRGDECGAFGLVIVDKSIIRDSAFVVVSSS